MIRINLVSSSAPSAGGIVFDGTTPSLSEESEVQKQGLIRLVLMLMGPIALYFYQQSVLPDLLRQRSTLQSEIAEMRDFNTKAERSVAEVKKFKEDEQRIQSRISYLDQIAKNRTRDIKILELLQQVIPEKAWLNRLEMNRGRLTIGGMAMTDFDVSSFMEALAKSVYFLDVNLVRSNEAVFDGLNLKDFEISCTVERPVSNE